MTLYAYDEDGESLKCDHCNDALANDEIAVHYFNMKLPKHEMLFCLSCYGVLSPEYHQLGSEHKVVICCDSLPPDAMRIVSPVEVTTTNRSLFDVVNLPSVRTINRAVRSGRPGYTFDNTLSIGWTKEEELKREQELLEIENDPAAFLLSCQNATPLLPGDDDEIKLIDQEHEGDKHGHHSARVERTD